MPRSQRTGKRSRLAVSSSHDLARVLPTRQSDQVNADRVRDGTFTFLNRTETFLQVPPWNFTEHGLLWQFHLHYFDYACHLAAAFEATQDNEYWEAFRRLVRSWIESNPTGTEVAWHPYVISVRLPNWIQAYQAFSAPISSDPDFARRLRESCEDQVNFLRRNLEYDVTGNHLIKNARALIIAGAFFDGRYGQSLSRRGRGLLLKQLREQVLGDGGHYERSPLYHAQVLIDGLDCLKFVSDDDEARSELRDLLRPMPRFLVAMTHEDGALGLFNDCVEHPDGLSVRDLNQLVTTSVGAPEITHHQKTHLSFTALTFPESGYVRVDAAEHRLLFDGGPLGPAHLMAHGHCDTLSFELSVAGLRLIVNSGTYRYEAGKWRDAFRGTAAHNTVQIGHEEQSAIWKSFRVGRRAEPDPVAIELPDEALVIRGSFKGFNENRIRHVRSIFVMPGPVWVIVDSVVSAKRDERLNACNRLHIHPAARVQVDPGLKGQSWIYGNSGASIAVLSISGQQEFEQGWYSPALGLKQPSTVITSTQKGTGSLTFGWILHAPSVEVVVGRLRGEQADWNLEVVINGEPRSLAAR